MAKKKKHFTRPFAAAAEHHMRVQGWTNLDMGIAVGYTDGKMLSAIRLEKTDGAENRRREIAGKLGFSSLDEFIKEGERLIREQNSGPMPGTAPDNQAKASNVTSLTNRHRALLDLFKQKELALEINHLLVEIESMDPDELKAVASDLKDKKFRLEHEQKKRTTGTDKA